MWQPANWNICQQTFEFLEIWAILNAGGIGLNYFWLTFKIRDKQIKIEHGISPLIETRKEWSRRHYFHQKTDDSYDQQPERFRKKQRAMRAFILRKIRISPAIAEQKSRSLAFSKLRDFQAVSS